MASNKRVEDKAKVKSFLVKFTSGGVGRVRMRIHYVLLIVGFVVITMGLGLNGAKATSNQSFSILHAKQVQLTTKSISNTPERFVYHSPHDFTYPEAVRGIYSTAYSAGGSRMEDLIQLIDKTDLNAVVIDIKDDYGNITVSVPKNSPLYPFTQEIIDKPKQLVKRLEKHNIYPIARIVVFKDSVLAEKHPEYTFKKTNGEIWKNGNGEAFVNPFLKEVWKYNVKVAKMAAELGFQEIQFDYVRFPEGFEHRYDDLTYSRGSFAELKMDDVKKRVKAVTSFVKYAEKELKWYDVKMSVDIFGYTATLPAAPGIGQNFSKISKHVDVISSMIYPSHWTSYFGIRYPDKQPYKLVDAYAEQENEKLAKLEDPPISRPWIQDFTASWLGTGHYIQYGKEEVEAQIRALNDNGIEEFLIWDASNSYTTGVDYTP